MQAILNYVCVRVYARASSMQMFAYSASHRRHERRPRIAAR